MPWQSCGMWRSNCRERWGRPCAGLLGEALQNPAVAAEIHDYARGNVVKVMRAIIEQAVARGECDPALATACKIEAGPALLRQRFIFSAAPIEDDYLVQVVDEVMLPLLGVSPPRGRQFPFAASG